MKLYSFNFDFSKLKKKIFSWVKGSKKKVEAETRTKIFLTKQFNKINTSLGKYRHNVWSDWARVFHNDIIKKNLFIQYLVKGVYCV